MDYPRQAALAALAGTTATIVALRTGWPLGRGLVLAPLVYVAVRIAFATWYRVRYWYGRGTRNAHHVRCRGCGRRIWRRGGDWILRCHTCGWTAGWPGVRWLTHSVPARQIRRSLSWGRLGVLFVSAIVVVGGSPAVVLSQFDDAAPTEDSGERTPAATSTTRTQTTTPTATPPPTATPTPTPTPVPDSDDDGLTDPRERQIGTDPNSADTDGDRLSDGEEVRGVTDEGWPIPNADPMEKDLYLNIVVTENVPKLTDRERQSLREIWASMPVDNPSGNSGITLHLNVTSAPAETSNGSESDFEALRKEYYDTPYLSAPAQCTAHVALLLEYTAEDSAGYASSPGYFSINDGTNTDDYGEEYTIRVTTITHELLHNIVGIFPDGSGHTSEGWLYGHPERHGTQFFMSDKTKNKLSENGFAESAYYQLEVC